MKRRDLVQLVLVIMAILAGFRFFTRLPSFVLFMISWFGDGTRGGYLMESLIGIILELAAYALICVFLITRSKNYAAVISDKASLSGDMELDIDKTELLYALFIGLGVYGLITEVPSLIRNAYTLFGAESKDLADKYAETPVKIRLAVGLVSTGLFFVLVYYARVFAEFAAGKINNIEPHEEITANN